MSHPYMFYDAVRHKPEYHLLTNLQDISDTASHFGIPKSKLKGVTGLLSRTESAGQDTREIWLTTHPKPFQSDAAYYFAWSDKGKVRRNPMHRSNRGRSTPMKKIHRSKRRSSPAQVAWRKKFAAMVRSGKFRRNAKRKPVGAPKMRHFRTKGTRFKSKRPYREQGRMVARRVKRNTKRRVRSYSVAGKHCVITARFQGQKGWYTGATFENSSARAVRFRTVAGAKSAAAKLARKMGQPMTVED